MISSALPWNHLVAFPALLAFVCMLLFSTATLAFYVKQRLSFARLQVVLGRSGPIGGSAVGATLGAATPFCTCTAVPLFLGMLEVDIPLGPAISFLLASPTINLGAIVLLLVVFGWRISLFYAGACLLAAIAVGSLLGQLPRQQALRDYLWLEEDEPSATRRGAATRSLALARGLTRRFLPWLVLATAAGILIDALLPTSAVAHVAGWAIVVAIPAAAALGALVYADILFLIPIGFALIRHGAPAPVILTFMLAASGLSLPELVVLSRILHRRPVVLFAGATLALYIGVGFGFAWLGVQ